MAGNTVGRLCVCGPGVHCHFVGQMLDHGRRNRTEHREKKPVGDKRDNGITIITH